MDNILMTDVPRLPPGSQPHAIVLRRDYSYDDRQAQVPKNIRDTIPAHFKKNGIFHLFKNEEGILYQRSPGDGRWGLAFVIRNGYQLHFVIPVEHTIQGAAFRPLKDKLADHCTIIDPLATNLSHSASAPLLERFIRSLWGHASKSQYKSSELGMSQQHFASFFSADTFQSNMDGILAGFLPGVFATIKDGNFTLDDLLRLPKATKDWPGLGPGLYLRVYTDLRQPPGNDISTAFYVGQTIMMWNRHIAHERQADLKTFAGHHYNIAAKALPQNRHTIPLCMWERDAINNESERFLNLAEQTIMLALETYHPSVHTTGSQNITMYPYASKASFLRGFAKKARESTGWGPMPNLKYIGCNMDSPLFSFFRGLRMNCFRMTSPDPAVRTFTTYRTWCPIQHLPTTDHVKIGYYPDTTANISPICFTPRDRINKSISRGYLVFEIMDDGHPHDRPWLGVPTVGTYENFDRASSLGVRFEWFDEKQDTWLTVPIERQRHNSGGAGSWSTAGYLSVWKLAITIIQLVEGVTWTQPSIGFAKIPSLRAVRVMEFSINHLQQTCQWVPRARSTSPAPKLATWVHNFDHMRRIFANDMTIVGPSQPPGIHDSFWRLTESDSRRMSRMKTICCDLCNYSARPSNDHKCERDETRSDIWVCKFCSLLNRPCTFTPPNRSKELWGDTPPLLHHLKRSVSGTGWSRYPSGPHRFLAFHHAIHMNELTTPVRVGTPWETRFEVDLGEEPKVEDIGDAVDSEVDD